MFLASRANARGTPGSGRAQQCDDRRQPRHAAQTADDHRLVDIFMAGPGRLRALRRRAARSMSRSCSRSGGTSIRPKKPIACSISRRQGRIPDLGAEVVAAIDDPAALGLIEERRCTNRVGRDTPRITPTLQLPAELNQPSGANRAGREAGSRGGAAALLNYCECFPLSFSKSTPSHQKNPGAAASTFHCTTPYSIPRYPPQP